MDAFTQWNSDYNRQYRRACRCAGWWHDKDNPAPGLYRSQAIFRGAGLQRHVESRACNFRSGRRIENPAQDAANYVNSAREIEIPKSVDHSEYAVLELNPKYCEHL